jgi:superfamily II DNA/RNA helicase
VQDRTAALRRFHVLVCTDAAARGLDIVDLPLVVHYEHPSLRQTFIHRSGRTARAGAKGTSISLVFPSQVYFFRKWAGASATKLVLADDATQT